MSVSREEEVSALREDADRLHVVGRLVGFLRGHFVGRRVGLGQRVGFGFVGQYIGCLEGKAIAIGVAMGVAS
jgi:hypothetical protein